MKQHQNGEIGTIIAITTFVILSVATAVSSFVAQNSDQRVTTATQASSCVVGKTLCDIPACNATLGGNPQKCPACNGGWCNGGVCGTCGNEVPNEPLPPPRNAPTATKAPPESCTPEGRKKGTYCDNFTSPGTCFFVDTVCGKDGAEEYVQRRNDRCDCATGQPVSGGGGDVDSGTQPTNPPAQPTQRPVATARPEPTDQPRATDTPASGGNDSVDEPEPTRRPTATPRATRTPTPRVSRTPSVTPRASATPRVSTTPRVSLSPTRAPAGNEPTSTPGPTPKICESRYRCLRSCGAIAVQVQGQVCSPGAICCNYKSSTVLEIYNWMEKDLVLKNICVRNFLACGDNAESLKGTKEFTVEKKNAKGPFIDTEILHTHCYDAEKDEVDVNKTITIQIDYKTINAKGEEGTLSQEFEDISCANKHAIFQFGRQ